MSTETTGSVSFHNPTKPKRDMSPPLGLNSARLLFGRSHHLHKQRLELGSEGGRGNLIHMGILHLESYVVSPNECQVRSRYQERLEKRTSQSLLEGGVWVHVLQGADIPEFFSYIRIVG